MIFTFSDYLASMLPKVFQYIIEHAGTLRAGIKYSEGDILNSKTTETYFGFIDENPSFLMRMMLFSLSDPFYSSEINVLFIAML